MHTRRRVDLLCTCQQRLFIVRSLGENTMSTPPGKRRRKICNDARLCPRTKKRRWISTKHLLEWRARTCTQTHAHGHGEAREEPQRESKKTRNCEKVKRLKKKKRSEKDGQVGAVRDSDAGTTRSIPPSSGGYQCTTQSRYTNPQRARWRLRKSGVTNKNNTRLFSFRRTDAIRACATGTLCLAAAAAIVISQTTTNPAQKL